MKNYASDLEDIFYRLWKRHESGQQPDHILSHRSHDLDDDDDERKDDDNADDDDDVRNGNDDDDDGEETKSPDEDAVESDSLHTRTHQISLNTPCRATPAAAQTASATRATILNFAGQQQQQQLQRQQQLLLPQQQQVQPQQQHRQDQQRQLLIQNSTTPIFHLQNGFGSSEKSAAAMEGTTVAAAKIVTINGNAYLAYPAVEQS